MTLYTRLALAAAAVFCVLPGSPAAAADLMPIIQQAPIVPVEIGAGWYLRGDIGYNFSIRNSGSVDYREFDPGSGTYTQAPLDSAELSKTATFDIGVGYQFSQWLRGDVTVGGWRGSFDGSASISGPCTTDPGLAGTGCRWAGSNNYTAISILANGYVDLGTYAGFTPYAGAGAGYTHVDFGGIDVSSYCVPGVSACPTSLLGSETHSGESGWRFTYAFMGGVSYDISKNMKIDVGYKYTHVSGGDVFGWDSASLAAGATGAEGSDHGINTQQVTVGLRYALW